MTTIKPGEAQRLIFHYINLEDYARPLTDLHFKENASVTMKSVICTFAKNSVVYVFDCPRAGSFIDELSCFYIPSQPLDLRRVIAFASCSSFESIPISLNLPLDFFTYAMTSPVKAYHHWKCCGRPTPLSDSELRIIETFLTGIVMTIAISELDDREFKELFLTDSIISRMFVGFIVASKILRSFAITPCSLPQLPCMSDHFLWKVFDSMYTKSLEYGYPSVFLDLVSEFKVKVADKWPLQELVFMLCMPVVDDADLVRRWVRAFTAFLEVSYDHVVFVSRLNIIEQLESIYSLLDGDNTVACCCLKILTVSRHIIDKKIPESFVKFHVEKCTEEITAIKLALLCLIYPLLESPPQIDLNLDSATDSVMRVFALHYLSMSTDGAQLASFAPRNSHEVLAWLAACEKLGSIIENIEEYFNTENVNIQMQLLNCIGSWGLPIQSPNFSQNAQIVKFHKSQKQQKQYRTRSLFSLEISFSCCS